MRISAGLDKDKKSKKSKILKQFLNSKVYPIRSAVKRGRKLSLSKSALLAEQVGTDFASGYLSRSDFSFIRMLNLVRSGHFVGLRADSDPQTF